MTNAPQILLQHHLRQLRLPTFQGEYTKQAQLCGKRPFTPYSSRAATHQSC